MSLVPTVPPDGPSLRPTDRRAARILAVLSPLLAGLALLLAFGLRTAGQPAAAPAKPARVRIGIAPGTWQGLNRNDASAALSMWARTILTQHDVALEITTELFESDEELGRAVRERRVEAASVLADQFVALDDEIHLDTAFATARDSTITERYVLLVRRGTDITALAGLRGKALAVQMTSRSCLALPWMQTLLAEQGQPAADAFFSVITRIEGPSRAILQVFFRQADATIVTEHALDIACELNPQLRKELIVLATSPEVVPAVFFFLPDQKPETARLVERAMLNWQETPSGRQVLTVFQSDGLVRITPAQFQSTRDLVVRYHRLPLAPAPVGKPAAGAAHPEP